MVDKDKTKTRDLLLGYNLVISAKNVPYCYDAEYNEYEVNFDEAERMAKDLISKIKDLKDVDVSVSEITLDSID